MRWRTDVYLAADGTEQRASTGGPIPMGLCSGSFQLSDADQRLLHAALTSGPATAVTIPLAHEGEPTTGVFSGAAVGMASTYADWLTAGRTVLVVGASGSYYTTTISGYSAGTLTLAAGPSSGTYPAGVTHVYPCESVYLDRPTVARSPVNLSTWQASGWCASARALTGAGGTAVTTFDSLPVIVARSVGSSDSETYATGAEVIQAGGAVAQATYRLHGLRARAGTWLIRSRLERQSWKLLLATLRGRWKPALAATWRPDLTLQAQPAGSASSLRVNESTATLDALLALSPRLQLEYADGSVGYVKASTWSDAGAYRAISLTAALPSTIPGGSVRTVSLLERVRLDTDDVAWEYDGSYVGRMTLPLVALEP